MSFWWRLSAPLQLPRLLLWCRARLRRCSGRRPMGEARLRWTCIAASRTLRRLPRACHQRMTRRRLRLCAPFQLARLLLWCRARLRRCSRRHSIGEALLRRARIAASRTPRRLSRAGRRRVARRRWRLCAPFQPTRLLLWCRARLRRRSRRRPVGEAHPHRACVATSRVPRHLLRAGQRRATRRRWRLCAPLRLARLQLWCDATLGRRPALRRCPTLRLCPTRSMSMTSAATRPPCGSCRTSHP